ncbi:MAG: hypothetical protein JXR34_08035 [Bacteroidales bacterium]|nr:hypothetical protein [Bacteroidales bacterium]
MIKTLLICIFLFVRLFAFNQIIERNLSAEKWTFQQAGKTNQYEAKLPGNVFIDLFNNQLIPDPFIETNELKVQWVDSLAFIYQVEFYVSDAEFNHDFVELIFEGIDSYSQIFLNNQRIASTDNMFILWRLDVKPVLRKGLNHLQIHFQPAISKAQFYCQKDSIVRPENQRVYIRKAQYMFGWDWGAKLRGVGIWKDVKLNFWNKARLQEISISQSNLTTDTAFYRMKSNVKFASKEGLRLRIQVYNPQNHIEDVFMLKVDSATVWIDGFLSNPQKWWPHDMGDQNLYIFEFSLFDNNQLIDNQRVKFGFRNIRLHQPKDKFGSEFYFSVDEKPVFAKGANLIPFHHFPSQVKQSDYLFYLTKVKEANMNMVRVWGGGIYESDIFYQICDSLGIMVWQDFMFAGTMYPANKDFLQSVNEEITQQIFRLRNHPSLVLWCGNNEISEAWHNWGWQKQFGYSKSDSTFLWSEYLTIFEERIPKILALHDSHRPYHPSSPTTGWGRPESLTQGDIHYWGVWWGNEPFEKYRSKVGRFVSEYGFQGLPNLHSLQKFIPKDELFLGSESMQNHQKHPTGYETINLYLRRDFPQSNDFLEYIYFSQLLQAKAFKTAIESHRLAKPYCMGSLLWQFNDSWPVVSWSLIDFYKSPKPAYYQVKHSFSPVLPVFQQRDSSLYLYVVSDYMEKKSILIKFQIVTFSGKILINRELAIEAQSNIPFITDSIHLYRISSAEPYVAYVEIFMDNQKSIQEVYFFQNYKDWDFPKPKISIKQIDNQYIELESDHVARHIWLQESNTVFDDNFIDLLPNKPIRIKYRRLNSLSLRPDSIYVLYFNGSLN